MCAVCESSVARVLNGRHHKSINHTAGRSVHSIQQHKKWMLLLHTLMYVVHFAYHHVHYTVCSNINIVAFQSQKCRNFSTEQFMPSKFSQAKPINEMNIIFAKVFTIQRLLTMNVSLHIHRQTGRRTHTSAPKKIAKSETHKKFIRKLVWRNQWGWKINRIPNCVAHTQYSTHTIYKYINECMFQHIHIWLLKIFKLKKANSKHSQWWWVSNNNNNI